MLTNIPRVVILGYNLRNHHGSLITIFLCMFFFAAGDGFVRKWMETEKEGFVVLGEKVGK